MTETPTEPTDIHAAGAQQDVPLPYAHLNLTEQGFANCPAIPYLADKDGKPDSGYSLLNPFGKPYALSRRANKPKEYDELRAKTYKIGDHEAFVYDFLYPPSAPPQWSPLNALALDDPSKFTLLWAGSVSGSSPDLVQPFADTLTKPTSATDSFWPTIASFGLPYNLLILSKVAPQGCAALAAEFGGAWAADDMDALAAAGLLYEIDMRIMALDAATRTHPDSTEVRFTPGTLTVLQQDPQSKALTPVLIQVSTKDGSTQTYRSTDDAWLYALQAVKTSITVYGIWLGHVYHWHIVTAAMQMTMYNRLPAGHRLRPLLEPQSQFLIDFDYILLEVVWENLAPPTPVDGPKPLLELLDRFASGREFFDDDPPTTLRNHGLDPADFTVDRGEPWDAYPTVGLLLDIWNITHKYVETVVDNLYSNDNEVASDTGLKAWMDASRDPSQGNVRGLPEMETRDDLIAVLTSLLYRVTAHGAASLNPSVNPVMSFVANFPPCLQSAKVPEPSAGPSPGELLDLLPHTATLGGMTTFYYTFAYTPPDTPLIPAGGVDKDPQFQPPYENCNPALVAYRSDIQEFIVRYEKTWNKALARIRGHDAEIPPYAQGQDQQWPRSIEI